MWKTCGLSYIYKEGGVISAWTGLSAWTSVTNKALLRQTPLLRTRSKERSTLRRRKSRGTDSPRGGLRLPFFAKFTFKLNLPTTIIVRTKVFYISLLKLVPKKVLLEKKVEIIAREEEFNIEKILDSRY